MRLRSATACSRIGAGDSVINDRGAPADTGGGRPWCVAPRARGTAQRGCQPGSSTHPRRTGPRQQP